jgi:hypothetical protein
MNFINQLHPFTYKEKLESFIILQTTIIEKQKNFTHFFIGRLSGNEQNLCGTLINKINIPPLLIKNMLFGAGIQFKSNKDIIDYVKLLDTATSHTDLLGVWDSSMYMQCKLYYDYIDKAYPKLKKICAHAIEPYYYLDHPDYKFNTIFENKKVLIITSHKETTLNQLSKGAVKNVFNKPIFHETTSFYIYKPPQQNGESHDNNSWSFHFDTMKNDINKIKKEFDFDIALVGCGGFGMIISDYIHKDLKSSVIYVGGALQLFFGIMGSRWSASPDIKKLQNTNWTNVLDSDKPKNIKLCENGCYW